MTRRFTAPIFMLLAPACSQGGAPAERQGLTVIGAYAYAPPSAEEVAVYFVVRNPTGVADTLVHVTTPEAAGVMYHRNVTDGGLVRMEHLETLVVGARDSLVLSPGGTHLMLTSPKKTTPGDTLHLGLSFARAGTRLLSVPVLAPGDPPPSER
jgi:copper(I)-binding protein